MCKHLRQKRAPADTGAAGAKTANSHFTEQRLGLLLGMDKSAGGSGQRRCLLVLRFVDFYIRRCLRVSTCDAPIASHLFLSRGCSAVGAAVAPPKHST